MTKSIFIDFDGTLAEHGRVPSAHLDAIGQAREAGHRVFLCTGRPKALVPAHFRQGVFDGLVCAAGGYVEIDGQVLADLRYPADLATRTAALLVEHDAVFILEAPDRLFTSPQAMPRVLAAFAPMLLSDDGREGAEEILAALEPLDDLSGCSFGKVSVVDSPLPVPDLAELLGSEIGALPNSVTGRSGHAGELYLRGIDKSLGIATVETHFGLNRSDIIAIGDGMNDLEMIGYAGIGVAVEGGADEVLAAAQHVIPGPASNGIAQGFVELGLIPPR
ncbi:MAG TPA: HAD hydrolase family protein [Arachnia sp.]|nr:HAD hydrolase family protein [Arachnia sp.]HMT87448.1 HAD hydrolase family protein [Arachnia sp.]